MDKIKRELIKILETIVNEKFNGNIAEAARFLNYDRHNLTKIIKGTRLVSVEKLIELVEESGYYKVQLDFKINSLRPLK